MQVAEHNFILGLNIPNYPEKITATKQSGLPIGADQPSFIPYHAFGPDKGSRACRVCNYGRYHGIVYFVGNHPDWDDIEKWLAFLEQQSQQRSKYLKAYFFYGNSNSYQKEQREKKLEKLGNALNIKYTALTFVPSLSDTETEVGLNKINPEVSNTFIIYRHKAIIDKYVDLKATTSNFKLISNTLDQTQSAYFDFPEPAHD